MNLNSVNNKVKRKPDRHRVGRGPGSGWGTRAGRGQDGAQARSGYSDRPSMEGGQMTFIRRIPKRGFTNAIFMREWSFVNLQDLEVFEDGDVVTAEVLLKRGIIPKVRSGLKVLGVGQLTKKITIRANRASKTAVKAIEAAGATLELIPAKGDEAKKQWRAKRFKGKTTLRRKAASKKQEQKAS